ncbi:MAG: V-type ATP synthase subunit E [Candidatus Gallimonas sp.]
MSKEAIVERILSDAEAEAAAIVKEAEEKAENIVAEARSRAEAQRKRTERETAERCKSIADGKAASARLDSAKILLAEKRRVIDAIYARARERLIGLSEKECLSLTEKLLSEYAERGDEIVFAENYAYASEAARLPVVKERALKISSERIKISGGFVLRGEIADKDLSYAALLEADREEQQAALAAELFR